MGASADQIEREIRETRERIDENLDVLQERAASNAVRYGRIAAIALVVTGAGVAGFVIYRRFRRPALKERVEGVSPQSILRKVAPTLIGTASSAVIGKMTRRSEARVGTRRGAYD